MTDRAILKIGRKVAVVADHTKFGRIATAFLAPVNAADLIVTDRGLDLRDRGRAGSPGAHVLKAWSRRVAG